MLNKIKGKILHVLREKCGYYELKLNYEELKLCNNSIAIQYEKRAYELFDLDNKIDNLKSTLEAKILEYDILFAKNEANILERDILDAQVKDFPNNYKKYLVAELEQILNIMKDKGVHPQDLIKRIVNKAKRDTK